MSSHRSSRHRSRSPGGGSQPRLRPLRDTAIEHYAISKGMEDKDWKALKAKADKVVSSNGHRISVAVHADGKDSRIECRVPSDSDSGTTYMQYINFNATGSRITGHTCDCPSSRKSERRQDAVCKHVVAALLIHIEEGRGSQPPSGGGSSGSQHRGTRSTPGSTPSRSAHNSGGYSTQSGSSSGRSSGRRGGGDDVWGLLEPKGAMDRALEGYKSTRPEFTGLIELHRSVMIIGKDNNSDIDVCNKVGVKDNFRTISTKHAAISCKLADTQKPTWGKNFLAIWDDTSSNGTHINGKHFKKNTSKEMHEGDEIRLGKEDCKVHFIFVSMLAPYARSFACTVLLADWMDVDA
jgi:hypothetical protein